MTITLFNNASPANFVKKSLTEIGAISGNIRNPSSIIDPVITIERDSPIGFNYAYMPDFSRYYFVTGISTEVNGLIAVSMHVDVLMTYKSQIANATAVIKRQENVFNLYLDDGIYKAYQNSKHKTISFPTGFNEYSFILALAGNSDG